jgi:hypothetical protein
MIFARFFCLESQEKIDLKRCSKPLHLPGSRECFSCHEGMLLAVVPKIKTRPFLALKASIRNGAGLIAEAGSEF